MFGNRLRNCVKLKTTGKKKLKKEFVIFIDNFYLILQYI